MEKTIFLADDVKDNQGNVIVQLSTALKGDGATPIVQTVGTGATGVIGYQDDGSPILSKLSDTFIENAQQNFMAEAIKEQKKLCVENGVDPDLVNILDAEKKVDTNDEQSTN